MNRIIIVGNGFDLAHGLKTNYKDFINWYWEKRVDGFVGCHSLISEDKLCTIEILEGGEYVCWEFFCMYGYKRLPKREDAKLIIDRMVQDTMSFKFTKSPFFENISRKIEERGWVDIENEYYIQLKNILNGTSIYKSSEDLNNELDYLKELLSEYLTEISGNTACSTNAGIKKQMFSPIKNDEIAVANRKQFNKFVYLRLDVRDQYWWTFLNAYGFDDSKIMSKLRAFDELKEERKTKYIEEDSAYEILTRHGLSDILLPERTMLLNFNYTNVADMYLLNNDVFAINHIHGSLNDTQSMIFGYGDELDNDYKRIQELNDNEYLKNVKSVRYLESTNYRDLLKFTEASPYQIYIMGHSCGNSDRTLLNTLFEHKNCVSIKPFYYKKCDEQGKKVSDNYMEIVQNISRNFTDMKLFRDRVVNKEYCESLFQVAKPINNA